jgi:hypothetical protein
LKELHGAAVATVKELLAATGTSWHIELSNQRRTVGCAFEQNEAIGVLAHFGSLEESHCSA